MVAVWKDFQSYEELENDGESNQTQDASLRKISIEIRWFYERDEIVGVSYSDSAGASDEIFETDHVDVINAATSLIAPVMLYVDSRPKDDEDDDDDNCIDVSMQKFVCRRFWSTTRKSLIPCGSLEGRQRRGWVYSKYLPEEMKRFSMEVKSCSASSSLFEKSANLTWKESMARIISKLTLRDASRGAYERGETLIGREKELHQLMLFFRAAIRGEAGPGGVRSSMFIGGPPGVGKTACVRAALARLRMEQTAGDVPKFKFIPLNGMEMRHPFEAYVKFWEALTGRKHVGSHEKACEYLETHFTSPKSLHGYQDKTVSVVLLDEIDYLMTEKQTVLYNFFDWPKRAEEVPNGRRLIVIGISNTLNLAEQLQTKVQSRVGSEKCLFKAYNLNDTVAILKSKIEEASPVRSSPSFGFS